MQINKKRKPYFNPYVLRQVLEDLDLPPIAREVLNKDRQSHKHNFLFPNFREKLIPAANKIVEDIEWVIEQETLYQLFEVYEEYINPSEEDIQFWYEELREQFNLPSDYEFE
ncbi:hypothetical protein [Bacillus zhangzhouensis]|uniref:hypothetical protein n=1 Tax=Bacillus zhangzhouensis TaxID=1178540 RepID=UPI0020C14A9E|nr:hypothetical protein [Bacillus zhangzhouensis]